MRLTIFAAKVFQKTLTEHKDLLADVCLALVVKEINSTVGPDGLCPQLLVFGILPRLPGNISKPLPAQKERMRALVTARDAYEKLVYQELVKKGLRKKPPPAADHIYKPGEFA